MIDNALSHASMRLGVVPKTEAISLPDLLRDIELDVDADAQARGVGLVISMSGEAIVSADPRLLRSAVFNLVHNALKFSPTGSTVVVSARVDAERATIEVADQCGGLPPGKTEDLFTPLVQRGDDRSGFGLGLSIARQAVEAQGGTIDVRNLPGEGCLFTIDLPASAVGS